MWGEEIIKWQRRNNARKLTKSMFSSIISKIWKHICPNVIQNGFQEAGISPYCDSVLSGRSGLNHKRIEDGRVSRKAKKLQRFHQHLMQKELQHLCC
jgi:hypothetical protein